MSTRASPSGLVPRVVALAALVMLLALETPAGTVEAADLSATIAATRRAQIAAEGSMRQADRQLKSLTRERRQARRRIRAATERLARMRERRTAVRERAESASVQLALARLRLEFEPPPAGSASVGSTLTDVASSVGASVPDPTFASVAGFPTAAGPHDATGRAGDPDGARGASTETIRRLESEARSSRTTARVLERRTRRLERNRSALVRSVPRIGSRMVASHRQRRGAEAVLGQHIRSMSKLAHKRVAKVTKPRRWSGFAWPVRGRISQGYHRGHDGLDIVDSRGTPIRAMAVGIVSYVGWNPWDQGRRAFVVVVAHPGGYETVYGHLLPIRRATVGRRVKKGQLIGHMGNTGRSTGVHLHIEVRRGFRTLDPLGVLGRP